MLLPLAVLGIGATALCATVGFNLARQSDALRAENERAAVRAGLAEYRSAYGDSDTVDRRLVDMVAQFSGLSDLQFETDPAAASQNAEPVLSTQGRISGFLIWRRDEPMTTLVWWAMPVIAGVALALVCFAAFAFRQMQRARAKLARRDKQAAEAAERDQLTGLYNHAKIVRLLDAAMASQSAQGVVTYALIALDGVQAIVDSYGHGVGDEMIVTAAANLRRALPEGTTAARVAPFEFAVLWSGIDDPEARLRSMLENATKPQWTDTVVRVAAHAGYAQAPRDATSSEDLARRAERALRAAGKKGKGVVLAFEHDFDRAAADEQFIRRELPRALNANAFELHYQPILAADGSGVRAVEALLRWTCPGRGLIPPSQFIPLAEEMGLIEAIGRSVLKRALADAARWGDVEIAVNLSPLQVRDHSIVEFVRDALSESGVTPSRLVLEITEGVLINNPDEMRKRIQELRALGVRIALDDFGSGYSSLGYLQRFPFDKLKIDRSFTASLGRSSNGGVIVQAIVALGRALDVTVVAEGVETDEQRVLLRLAGCDELQGFLFAKPAPAKDIDTLLAKAKPAKFAAA
jgi:diguanylate cyclase (GGDEF)-like protein